MSEKDILGQAKAAAWALQARTKDWSDRVGITVNGRAYGVKFNRTNVTVYPQPDEAPTDRGGAG